LGSAFRRFIPACAGNALPHRAASASVSVHPRVRGERAVERESLLTAAGSSPRARGTPDQVAYLIVINRFIPACAGNATIFPRKPSPKPVHPRVRGERGFRWGIPHR